MPGELASIRTRQFIAERLVPSLLKISVRCFIIIIIFIIFLVYKQMVQKFPVVSIKKWQAPQVISGEIEPTKGVTFHKLEAKHTKYY